MLLLTNLLSIKQIVTLNAMLFVYKMVNYLVPRRFLDKCKFIGDIRTYNTLQRDHSK